METQKTEKIFAEGRKGNHNIRGDCTAWKEKEICVFSFFCSCLCNGYVREIRFVQCNKGNERASYCTVNSISSNSGSEYYSTFHIIIDRYIYIYTYQTDIQLKRKE